MEAKLDDFIAPEKCEQLIRESKTKLSPELIPDLANIVAEAVLACFQGIEEVDAAIELIADNVIKNIDLNEIPDGKLDITITTTDKFIGNSTTCDDDGKTTQVGMWYDENGKMIKTGTGEIQNGCMTFTGLFMNKPGEAALGRIDFNLEGEEALSHCIVISNFASNSPISSEHISVRYDFCN